MPALPEPVEEFVDNVFQKIDKSVWHPSTGTEGGGVDVVDSPGYTKPLIAYFGPADFYGMLLGLMLSPLALMVYVFSFIFPTVLFLILKIYSLCLPVPCIRVRRGIAFHILMLICFIIHAPYMGFVFLYVVLVRLVSILFCAPVGFLFRGPWKINENFKLIKPYAGTGPWSWSNVLVLYIGVLNRESFFSVLKSHALMMTVNPILKWILICNPYIHNLEIRFCNQWTAKIPATVDESYDGFIRNLSYTNHIQALDKQVDKDIFKAHYPFPPPGYPDMPVPTRDFQAKGLMGYKEGDLISCFTVCFIPPKGKYPPTSKSGKITAYIVPLYFDNPFEYLTGYVEANVRSNAAIEHPMWLLCGSNYFACLFFNQTNKFFFGYAPQIAKDIVLQEKLEAGQKK